MLFEIAGLLNGPCQGVAVDMSIGSERITFWDAGCREYGVRCSLTGTVTLYREGYDRVRIGTVADGATALASAIETIVSNTY